MDKQKIDKLVNKILKAKKLMEEVDAEIGHCGLIDFWQIFNESDFERVCEVLGIKAFGTHIRRTYYKGLEIVCVY